MTNLFRLINYSAISILLVIIYACSKQKGVDDMITQAYNIVEQQPDSALQLLNSILFPENLNKSRLNKYYLLLVEAKDKCYKDITSDTVIFAIKDYYVQKKDFPNAALAAFYCGRVWHGQNNMEKAVEAYMEAEELVDKIQSSQLATSCGMPELQSDIKESMGVTYQEQGLYEQAKKLFNEALALSGDSLKQARTLLNIAQVYVFEDNADSVYSYLNKASVLHINNHILMRTSYLLKSEMAEKNKQYLEALNDYKEYYHYTIKLFDGEKDNKLLEIQEKHDYEKIKNAQNQLIIKQQEVVIILASALLLTGIIISFFYKKIIQNRKLLLETVQKISNLQKVADNFSKINYNFHDIVLDQFGILRKTILIKTSLSEIEQSNGQKLLKKFNEIVYGQDIWDWNKLYLVIDNLKDGLYSKVRIRYSQLNEMEFRICCLTCEADFSDKEIATTLGMTLNMVRRIRSDVRKKIGMTKGENFFIFSKIPCDNN
jgi:tetratricopeptide (TPR) repeat protein/DNA-binding CsgD family transcriptional regulator